MVVFIKTEKQTLSWHDLDRIGNTNAKQQWYPRKEIASYFDNVQEPSRDQPNSYARSALTKKFANWIIKTHPLMAVRLELGGYYRR